jgi:hypothetical protein
MSKGSATKGSATTRFSTVAMAMLALPLFATAQHRGGAGVSAPAAASRPAPVISRAASPTVHASGRPVTRAQSAPRFGAPMVRTRNGVSVHRHNNNNANFAFNNGTDFQNVPGLGFDFPHLAAVSGNRGLHNGRFARGFGGFPFGFSGFLLSPSIIGDDIPADSQTADAQSSAADDQEIADDAPPQRAPRRSRSARQIAPEADSTPAPPREEEQYVFVRRDGSLVFAVAYAWESETLRYITPDGLRHSIGRDALDIEATQQFNEQRGVNFRAPA